MGSCFSSSSPTSTRGNSDNNKKKTINNKKRRKKHKAVLLRASSSFNLKREELLQSLPGRICVNGSSHSSSLFTQQGKKGTNQDAMIVWENFGSKDTVFCGVFDGHGPFGHLVSRTVRDWLPVKLVTRLGGTNDGLNREDLWQNCVSAGGSMNSEEMGTISFDEEPRGSHDSVGGAEKFPEIFSTHREAFLRAFKAMDGELRVQHNVNCFCSGTTAVTLIKQDQDLLIGNVGDSRAVLGTRDDGNCLTAVQLTVDLKPNLPKEEERIKSCKGRVFALHDEPDVARVWLPNNNSPGLAMARAFGDFCLKEFGLISVPEISYRRLTERDDFIVLATDGVWDALSNDEVVEIVASAPSRSSAARFLVESAVRAWRYKYPTSKVDDCAVVCLFLNADLSNSAASYSDTKEPSQSSEGLENGDAGEVSSVPSFLIRSGTVRSSSDQSVLVAEINESPRHVSRSRSGSSNHNKISMIRCDSSELEGVSRVDTVMRFPRFMSNVDNDHADSDFTK